MITEIRVPIRPGSGRRTAKSSVVPATGRSPRPEQCVRLDGDTVAEVGIGLTAVGAEHFCAPDAEDALRGEVADRRGDRRGRGACRRALQPGDRPARTGGLQASPRRRADEAGAATGHRPGTRRGGADDGRHAHRNGETRTADVEPRVLLVHLLRDQLRPDRHPLGLRHVELRRLCRAARWHAGEELHGARRDGRRPLRRHRRGTRAPRRARPGAAGLHGVPRAAMRILHAGDDAHRSLAARPQSRSRARRRSARRSAGNSAAARATTTSSSRSAGPPSMPRRPCHDHDRR